MNGPQSTHGTTPRTPAPLTHRTLLRPACETLTVSLTSLCGDFTPVMEAAGFQPLFPEKRKHAEWFLTTGKLGKGLNRCEVVSKLLAKKPKHPCRYRAFLYSIKAIN